MANILTAPAETMPGPASNRNAAMSITTGPIVPVAPVPPTTGQIWPRGG